MDVVVIERLQFAARGLVLPELYLPTALMLAGLILRGAAFDFRGIGVCVTLPVIIACTGFSYRVFRGKTIELDDA